MRTIYLFPVFDCIFETKSLIMHSNSFPFMICPGIGFAIEDFLERYKLDISDIIWKVNTTGYHTNMHLVDIKAKDIDDFMKQFNDINPKFIEHEKDIDMHKIMEI